jgi:hypothetical protein
VIYTITHRHSNGRGGDDVDGDGSRGTSPSRESAGTETSVPRNWSSMTAAMRNYSGKNTDCFRVFRRMALYRRRGGVRGGIGPPHHRAAWAKGGGGHHPRVWLPSAPLPPGSRSVFVLRLGKIGVSVFVSSNSENISRVAFLKHKNSRKQGSGIVASHQ